MRVLNIVDGSGWTGGVEQAMLLARELRDLDVDARLAVHGANPVLAEARSSAVPTYVYDDGRGSLKRCRRLRALLREEYDVVIGHKPGAIRHVALPRWLGCRHVPLVGVRRVSFPVSPLTVYRLPQAVVAVAESVRKILLDSGLPAKRIHVIPSGVDTVKFVPDAGLRSLGRSRLGLDENLVFLNLAKFVPAQKGQHLLMEAAASLRSLGGAKIVLAGLETDGAAARSLVREHGIAEDVLLLGFRRDIPELLNASDVFVFPSLPGLDAIAGSVLQAMACEKVVVASAVGGLGEYLRDGENGYLVPPGDAASLAQALARAANLSGEERERMGRNARATVLEGYSVRKMALSYLELFRRL